MCFLKATSDTTDVSVTVVTNLRYQRCVVSLQQDVYNFGVGSAPVYDFQQKFKCCTENAP